MKTPLAPARKPAPAVGLSLRTVGSDRWVVKFADLRFPCPRSRLVIGKNKGCDITVAGDSLISREHCVLFIRAGRLVVEDLRSSNGTSVNGVAVERPTAVHVGQRIGLGETIATVVDEAAQIPLTATTYSSFLRAAYREHGSLRAAATAIHRGPATVQRALAKHRRR